MATRGENLAQEGDVICIDQPGRMVAARGTEPKQSEL